MHECAANRDDISNGAFNVDSAEISKDFLIARAAKSCKGFLIANFLPVAKFLLELIFGSHQRQQWWC